MEELFIKEKHEEYFNCIIEHFTGFYENEVALINLKNKMEIDYAYVIANVIQSVMVNKFSFEDLKEYYLKKFENNIEINKKFYGNDKHYFIIVTNKLSSTEQSSCSPIRI